jgi:hypothetical protein
MSLSPVIEKLLQKASSPPELIPICTAASEKLDMTSPVTSYLAAISSSSQMNHLTGTVRAACMKKEGKAAYSNDNTLLLAWHDCTQCMEYMEIGVCQKKSEGEWGRKKW